MAAQLDLTRNFLGHSAGLEMSRDHPISEQEILDRVKTGDKEAYQAIVVKYMKRAYFIALSYVHNHQDALDISQEAFVRAYRRIKAYDPRRPFFPWLYEILKNLSLDHLKSRKTKLNASLADGLLVYAASEDREMKATIWKGIDSLPPDQKEILLLRYFQELSYKEIAELTGKPTGTVMSTLFCARIKLKEILGEYLGFKGEEFSRRGTHGS